MNTGDRHMQEQIENKSSGSGPHFEIITCEQLAQRLNVPETWVRDQVRQRALDPIPHLKLGRYTRFLWASPELEAWINRRKISSRNRL